MIQAQKILGRRFYSANLKKSGDMVDGHYSGSESNVYQFEYASRDPNDPVNSNSDDESAQ